MGSISARRRFGHAACRLAAPLVPVFIVLVLVLVLGLGLGLGACSGPGTPPPRTAPPPGGDPGLSGGAPGARPEAPPPNWMPVEEPPAHVDPVAGLRFPKVLGGLRFVGVQRFGRPELGYGLRYQNNTDLWIDIFVYDLGQKKIPDGATDPALVQHFGQVEGDIRAVAQRGHYTQLVASPRTQVTLEGRPFLLASYTYRNRGVSVSSRLYLTGYRRHYVKVRATWWVALGAQGATIVDGAVKALAGRLR